MADDLAIDLMKRFGALESQRQTWESHWQEVGDFIIPRKADITRVRSPGDKRTELIFDGTAGMAAQLLSSSLHGMLTNMSTKWFSLQYQSDELNMIDEAREWLGDVERKMYAAFQRSNFNEQIHELYHDLVTFGTAIMFVEQDDEFSVNFSTRHISECYVTEDDKGRIDTVYRKFKMPARAAINRFGEENFTSKMLKLEKEKPYENITLLHAVYKRDDRDTTKVDAQNKPIASVYLEPDEKKVLSESGFDEFPYLTPRFFKASFEIGYGRSPAMTALADVKMINAMSEVSIRAAQKQVDPPLLVPDDGFILPIRTVPGGLNFYRAGSRDRLEPLNIGANNPVGLNMEEQRRKAIQSAFYVDQLTTGQSPTMTATQIIQMTEEKMRIMGPLLGRLQAELLQPLISRTYNILARSQAFKPAPESIQGEGFDIEYVSPLAKAQRAGDVQSILQFIELSQPLANIDPGVVDYLDTDNLIKHLISALSVPAKVVRDQAQVEEIRESRSQQQAAQAEQEQLAQAAEAAGNAAPFVKAVANE